jgi:hypothetical protein
VAHPLVELVVTVKFRLIGTNLETLPSNTHPPVHPLLPDSCPKGLFVIFFIGKKGEEWRLLSCADLKKGGKTPQKKEGKIKK